MPQQTHSVIPPEIIFLLVMLAFGAYHGVNPGMGWLFALSMGLQRQSERAIWVSLLPIAVGHAVALGVVVTLVLIGARLISAKTLEVITALVLIAFGLFKIFNYYRHPRWVGMQVSLRDLAWWSFLMAMAHGAGLMIAPLVLALATPQAGSLPTAEASTTDTILAANASHLGHQINMSTGLEALLGVLVHTLSMLLIMALIALVVYRKVGLSILRRHWVNFDLIWAVALLIVGVIALLGGFGIL